jgi:hypothetical protein
VAGRGAPWERQSPRRAAPHVQPACERLRAARAACAARRNRATRCRGASARKRSRNTTNADVCSVPLFGRHRGRRVPRLKHGRDDEDHHQLARCVPRGSVSAAVQTERARAPGRKQRAAPPCRCPATARPTRTHAPHLSAPAARPPGSPVLGRGRGQAQQSACGVSPKACGTLLARTSSTAGGAARRAGARAPHPPGRGTGRAPAAPG